MVVVMGLVAFLSLLSVSVLVGARDQATVSDMAEKTLAAIRDAQNRAISVKQGNGVDDAKVWGIKVVNSAGGLKQGVYLGYFSPVDDDVPSSGLQFQLVDNNNGKVFEINDPRIQITTYHDNQKDTNSTRLIAFSAPFGQAYSTTPNLCNNKVGTWPCYWQQSNTTVQDWVLKGSQTENFSARGKEIEIEISLSGKYYKDLIKVEANGDSSVEAE
jgi:type II secretory pathway pseudopilin PulG